MTYEEKKNLVDAVQTINEICARYRALYDKDCEFPMKNNDRAECEFWRNQIPAEWNIPKLTRWTSEDVALAKALKAVGAKFLRKTEKCIHIDCADDDGPLGELTPYIFNALNYGETISIDTIIREAEE